jgi:hypothetical protein
MTPMPLLCCVESYATSGKRLLIEGIEEISFILGLRDSITAFERTVRGQVLVGRAAGADRSRAHGLALFICLISSLT